MTAPEAYTVLVNSFMYQGGDNYDLLATYDPNGVDTGLNYRDPLVSWIEAQNTSESNPLIAPAVIE